MEFCIGSLSKCKIFQKITSLNQLQILRTSFRRSFSEDFTKNKNNRIYAFGLSEHGALGLKTDSIKKVKKYVPKPIRHFFAEEKNVSNVAAGFGFTAFSVVSRDTYKVYGSGINTDYQIGYHLSLKQAPLEIILKPVPINIGLKFPETNVVRLSAGRAHLAVVTDKEGVFLLGSNVYGQCGREIFTDDELQGSCMVNNIINLGNEEIIDVCCGQDHTLFLTNDGKVWSCGWGADGQTGQGHTNICYIPALVRGDIENEKIVKVVGQSDCILALNCHGEVFGWGSSEYGQINENKNIQQLNSPCKLQRVKNIGKIIDIAAGGSFCMALNESGDVFVWGFGILGCGPELQKTTEPVQIPRTLFGCNNFQPDTRVCSIFCGLSHLAAINNYNQLYTWGRNRYGCLGIGHNRDQFFPYKVALSALSYKVSCGLDHTMVLCKPLD